MNRWWSYPQHSTFHGKIKVGDSVALKVNCGQLLLLCRHFPREFYLFRGSWLFVPSSFPSPSFPKTIFRLELFFYSLFTTQRSINEKSVIVNIKGICFSKAFGLRFEFGAPFPGVLGCSDLIIIFTWLEFIFFPRLLYSEKLRLSRCSYRSHPTFSYFFFFFFLRATYWWRKTTNSTPALLFIKVEKVMTDSRTFQIKNER